MTENNTVTSIYPARAWSGRRGRSTGVELAGTLGELAHGTLKDHFRSIDPAEAHIFLLEGAERILAVFPPELSAKATVALTHLGVTVRTRTHVTDIRDSTVTMRSGEAIESLQARTIIWTAGVKASVMGEVLAKHTGVTLDRAGRVQVKPDLTIPGPSRDFRDWRSGPLCPSRWQTAARRGNSSHPARSLCRHDHQPEAAGERPATVSLSPQREPGNHRAQCWRRRFRPLAYTWFPGMDTVVRRSYRLFNWLR